MVRSATMGECSNFTNPMWPTTEGITFSISHACNYVLWGLFEFFIVQQWVIRSHFHMDVYCLNRQRTVKIRFLRFFSIFIQNWSGIYMFYPLR